MARMRKKLGAVLVGAAALSLDPHRMWRRWWLRRWWRLTPRAVPSTPAKPPATSELLAVGFNQQPAYQACADKFQAGEPNINVKITQYGWDDYWSKLTNGFRRRRRARCLHRPPGSKYPEFVTQEQLVPLDDTLTKDRLQRQPVPGRPGRPVERPGRQTLWPAQATSTPSRSSTTRS